MGGFHPILQRVTADRTGCVTGLRHQELLVSAMVLGAAIVTSDNGRHFGNMRSRSPVSSMDGCHIQITPPPGAHSRDPVTRNDANQLSSAAVP
jgi:hypothetical protein